MEFGSATAQQLFLFDSDHLQSMMLAGIDEHGAKELTFGGMNQGMGSQDGSDGWEGAPRTEENAADQYSVSFSASLIEAITDCLLCQRG